MRKISLSNYQVTVGDKQIPYNVKDSIVNIVLNPDLQLNGTGLLKNNVLAQKVVETPGSEILLEEAEYQIIRTACDSLKGFGREDVELVRRIMEAPKVTVKEDKEATDDNA